MTQLHFSTGAFCSIKPSFVTKFALNILVVEASHNGLGVIEVDTLLVLALVIQWYSDRALETPALVLCSMIGVSKLYMSHRLIVNQPRQSRIG